MGAMFSNRWTPSEVIREGLMEKICVDAGSTEVKAKNLFRGYMPRYVIVGMVAENSVDQKNLTCFRIEKCLLSYAGKTVRISHARWLDMDEDNFRHVWIFDMTKYSPLVLECGGDRLQGYEFLAKFREPLTKNYNIYLYGEDCVDLEQGTIVI